MIIFANHYGKSNAAKTAGFVLPLTLWMIALFGLGVAAINNWVSNAVENARALQQLSVLVAPNTSLPLRPSQDPKKPERNSP